jgi:hypothetical protein
MTSDDDDRPPLEARPERIPSPQDLEKIKALFQWIDYIHEEVRTPWGIPWIEIQILLASLGQIIDWARSDPPIDSRYRYRIDAPMNPHPEVPDNIPEEWT